MQAGIPKPKDSPRKRETRPTTAKDVLPKAKNNAEETTPVISHTIRKCDRSNLFPNEAQAKADTIKAEK